VFIETHPNWPLEFLVWWPSVDLALVVTADPVRTWALWTWRGRVVGVVKAGSA